MMAGIVGSTDDARDLLSLMHDQPRHWTTLARAETLTSDQAAGALEAAERLRSGAPLQYAARRAAFRHLFLDVDERVLIPRPETELLVELVLREAGSEPGGIAVDVGTGSGAIAIALAAEGSFDRVIATDVSRDALEVAMANVERCRARTQVELRHGSLLGPVPERGLRAIVSNPPYIAYGEAGALPALVRDWEPSVALFSGADGLDATLRLVREAARALRPLGVLALEVDMRRAAAVGEVAASSGFDDVRIVKDLTGRDRFVVARRGEELE